MFVLFLHKDNKVTDLLLAELQKRKEGVRGFAVHRMQDVKHSVRNLFPNTTHLIIFQDKDQHYDKKSLESLSSDFPDITIFIGWANGQTPDVCPEGQNIVNSRWPGRNLPNIRAMLDEIFD